MREKKFIAPMGNLFKRLSNLKTRLIATYCLNIFDMIATGIWIAMFGLDVEANWLARWMYSNNSIYVVKTIGVAIGMWALNKFIPQYPKWVWTTWVLFGIYGAIAIYHLFLAFKLFTIMC